MCVVFGIAVVLCREDRGFDGGEFLGEVGEHCCVWQVCGGVVVGKFEEGMMQRTWK